MSDIQKHKQAAKKLVDQHAERSRMQLITPGYGQMLIYQEKCEEAVDYIAAGCPQDLSQYPLILCEVNATNKTGQQTAEDIIAAKSSWITQAANIEQVRLGAKKQIDSATTEQQVYDILHLAIDSM